MILIDTCAYAEDMQDTQCPADNSHLPSLSLEQNYPVGETAYHSLQRSRLVKRYPVFSDLVLTLHLFYKWKSRSTDVKVYTISHLDPRYTSYFAPVAGRMH